MKRIMLATALGLILASPGLAPGQSVSEEARLQIQAAEQKARVEEAKELLREQGKLEERIKEIVKRLGELDAGAKARERKSCDNCITIDSVTTDIWRSR